MEATALPGELRGAVSLADFTTWKVGGPAQWFCEPETNDQVIGLARWARRQGLPLQLIGAGSNLLISDTGLGGLTLCQRRLQGSQLDGGDGWIEAQAGEPIPTLARRAARAGLGGLEWAVGIPGTVGGAVVMNAGAQGVCTSEWLQEVTVFDPNGDGEPFVLPSRDLEFSYRHSRRQQEPLVVLAARFRLRAGLDPAEVSQRTSANLRSRTSSQPYQQPSCGSVFRNPEPGKAGQLIEALGLKGFSVGGAQVSTLHANFIVNTGAARASDMDQLIALVQERVRQVHGIELHPEVQRLGPFAAAAKVASLQGLA